MDFVVAVRTVTSEVKHLIIPSKWIEIGLNVGAVFGGVKPYEFHKIFYSADWLKKPNFNLPCNSEYNWGANNGQLEDCCFRVQILKAFRK